MKTFRHCEELAFSREAGTAVTGSDALSMNRTFLGLGSKNQGSFNPHESSAVALNWVVGFLGSDPNDPEPLYPCAPAAVASNCVVRIDSFVFVFILAPLYSPRPFPAPPGGKEEPTATFGRVNKQRKYMCRGTLKTKMDFEIWNSAFGIGCFGTHAVLAGLSSAAADLTAAVFSFGSLSLDKQRKGTRLPGRNPACREASFP